MVLESVQERSTMALILLKVYHMGPFLCIVHLAITTIIMYRRQKNYILLCSCVMYIVDHMQNHAPKSHT